MTDPEPAPLPPAVRDVERWPRPVRRLIQFGLAGSAWAVVAMIGYGAWRFHFVRLGLAIVVVSVILTAAVRIISAVRAPRARGHRAPPTAAAS